MTPEQLAVYQAATSNDTTLSIRNVGTTERTLAFGYTCNRDTWHAYVQGGELHVLTYPYRGAPTAHLHGESMEVEALRPDKRVYPDTVDSLFARLMFDCGAELPLIGNFDFTTPDVTRRMEMGPFKGYIHTDF